MVVVEYLGLRFLNGLAHVFDDEGTGGEWVPGSEHEPGCHPDVRRDLGGWRHDHVTPASGWVVRHRDSQDTGKAIRATHRRDPARTDCALDRLLLCDRQVDVAVAAFLEVGRVRAAPAHPDASLHRGATRPPGSLLTSG